jgi:hypothetical protein
VIRLIADNTVEVTIKQRQEQRDLFELSLLGFNMGDDEQSRRRVAKAYGLESDS